MTLYALTVICLLPVGGFLSIAGGFLFEEPISIFYILIGSTLGACTLFTLARGPLRTLYLNNAREQLKKIDKKFKKNSIQFLLFLRLIPFSPFWLVNLACAFFGVKFWRFAWTTFVGNIIPTLIFVQIGAQFETLIKAGQEISVHSIFNWRIILLLLTLALVPLLSIFFKKR